MSAKQQINQRIIFDEYVKSCYKIYNEEVEKNDMGSLRVCYEDCQQSRYKHRYIDENGNFKFSYLLRELNITNYYDNFNKTYPRNKFDKPRDYGKEFFDYAKQRSQELGMPKSTFKTIKDTRVRATQMLHEWWGQFATTQEMLDWFDGENEIMLK